MIGTRTFRTGLIGVVIAAGSILTVGTASATTTGAPSSNFLRQQKALELQLSNRQAQLVRLGADVSAAKTLTPAHATTLNMNITTATTNINALAIKVPTDTTMAQIKADQRSMLAQNRVYAVLTPQVIQVIEADQIAMQVSGFLASEATLQSSVNALVGQVGYKNALNHYVAFVKVVNAANVNSSNVVVTVLAQTPADFPGDTHVFVHANKELLAADIDLAHASYDEAVIGLASGGYTGS